jgi:hypothetical protein
MMRELIFNDLSVATYAASTHAVAPLVADVTRGIAQLIDRGITEKAVRSTAAWTENVCADDGTTVWDAIVTMRHMGCVEEFRLISSLVTKVPLLAELPENIVDRFNGCEPDFGNEDGGGCLVLCAHTDAIAVSIPIQARFDVDRLNVRFKELNAVAELCDEEELIDNVARSIHAEAIIDRARLGALGKVTLVTFWNQRLDLFPHLRFGADFEQHLQQLNPGITRALISRLAELDAAAADWPALGTEAPQWRSKVTPESDSVMNNPASRSRRIFRDAMGSQALFSWHARIGSGIRLHLRFDRSVHLVEIGYVGQHLP